METSRSVNVYKAPVDLKLATLIVTNSASHTGPFEGAVDIAVPLGTPVHASRDGVVVTVVDTFNQSGDTIMFGKFVNLVQIQHDNEEFSEYLHLAKGSAVVKVGDRVQCGKIIAKTGLSGYMTAPHVHWAVFKRVATKFGSQCLAIQTEADLAVIN